jgi:AcrR family transcriptional regulator
MTTPPTSRKRGRYHHGNLPAALVAAAIEVLAEVGVEALTLREVAHRVGVTHAAPYRHFKGKSVLLAAVAEEGFARLSLELEAARRERPKSVSSAAATGAAYLRFACAHAALYRLMFAADERTVGLRSAAEALVSEVMAVLRESGQDNEALARLLWSSWHGLATLHSAELLGSADEDVETLAASAADRLLRSGGVPDRAPARQSTPRAVRDSDVPEASTSRPRIAVGSSEMMALAGPRLGHDDEPSR